MATFARFYDDILILKLSAEITEEELSEVKARIASASGQVGTLIVALEGMEAAKAEQTKALKQLKADLTAMGSPKVTFAAASSPLADVPSLDEALAQIGGKEAERVRKICKIEEEVGAVTLKGLKDKLERLHKKIRALGLDPEALPEDGADKKQEEVFRNEPMSDHVAKLEAQTMAALKQTGCLEGKA